MLDWFNFYGHVCISFELLSVSTFDFLKANSFVPYTLDQIRQMAQQVCQAVRCESNNHVTRTSLNSSPFILSEKHVKIMTKKPHSNSNKYPLQKHTLKPKLIGSVF